ncbi:Trimeric GatFAB AmidoTransferase(AdT) complex subunit [Terramyces sp. JEL0728]|nr:Trimeric GatFAB AmidoTransferase(AdT) complex subunit [Terramyces sp. JEL0728]
MKTEKLQQQIQLKNKKLNALISQTNPQILLDQLGKNKGRLADLTTVIKDNFATLDLKTTCGSKMLSNYQSPIESTVARKLKQEGALMIGKTNMDEFGMGSFNTNSNFGPALNPIDDTRVCGGSSGGSAAAVAAGFCQVELGLLSDVYGTDWLMLDVLKGKDALDPTTVEFKDSTETVPVETLRIGVPAEYHVEGISDSVLQVWSETLSRLEKKGATIVPVSIPSTQAALSAYYILAPAEAYSNLAKYDGIRYGCKNPEDSLVQTRTIGFGNEVKKRIMIGAFVLKSLEKSKFYIAAQKVRSKVQQDFDKVFKAANPLTGATFKDSPQVDALLTPSALAIAPTLELTKSKDWNPYINDVFTVPISLAGLPAISLNAGSENGMPIGMQIVGQYGRDKTVLDIAKLLSQ